MFPAPSIHSRFREIVRTQIFHHFRVPSFSHSVIVSSLILTLTHDMTGPSVSKIIQERWSQFSHIINRPTDRQNIPESPSDLGAMKADSSWIPRDICIFQIHSRVVWSDWLWMLSSVSFSCCSYTEMTTTMILWMTTVSIWFSFPLSWLESWSAVWYFWNRILCRHFHQFLPCNRISWTYDYDLLFKQTTDDNDEEEENVQHVIVRIIHVLDCNMCLPFVVFSGNNILPLLSWSVKEEEEVAAVRHVFFKSSATVVTRIKKRRRKMQ